MTTTERPQDQAAQYRVIGTRPVRHDVSRATGVRMHDVPMSPGRILEALEGEDGTGGG